jgi:hypothetical protein
VHTITVVSSEDDAESIQGAYNRITQFLDALTRADGFTQGVTGDGLSEFLVRAIYRRVVCLICEIGKRS